MKMKMFKKACLTLAAVLAITAVNVMCADEVYAAELGEITVNGTGSVSIAPDVAYVTLGVTTQDASPRIALEQNNKLITTVIDALLKQDIEEKDIMTTNFYMYPNYDYARGDNVVTGYSVNNSVSVTIRDINKVGDVLDAAIQAGANVSGGIQFGLVDNTAAYNEALTLAIHGAAEKAATVANALGVTIGSPSAVIESGGNYTAVYNASSMKAMESAAGVPTQAGELTVTASVQMVFEY